MTNQPLQMDLWRLLLRRKLHLLIISVVAGIAACVFSGEWFIKPLYRSSAVLYPSNLIPYSEETPSEQLLQLFESADVRDTMIQFFQLGEHYGLGKGDNVSRSKLELAYEENVLVRKTEFESVRIDVFDADPQFACKMADQLIRFVDIKARMLQRQKTREVAIIWAKQLENKQRQIDSLSKLQNEMRVRFGILDYKTQAREITKTALKMQSGGASRQAMSEVDTLMRNLQEKGSQASAIDEMMKSTLKSYAEIKVEYDKTISDLTKELTYSNVVTRPFPADTKSYPIRWLIVLTSVISSFIFGIILFAFIDGKLFRAQN